MYPLSYLAAAQLQEDRRQDLKAARRHAELVAAQPRTARPRRRLLSGWAARPTRGIAAARPVATR